MSDHPHNTEEADPMTETTTPPPREVMLIDLSSLAHPLWHVSVNDPDPNATSTKTVARVRALATDHPHVAVCCDSGRSFRKDVDSSYKADRPETNAVLVHQIKLAQETLANDGFPVWSVKGFEADDLLASATRRALEIPDVMVTIVSSDKDLLALVGPRVSAKSLTTDAVMDEAGVVEKFGVRANQMTDYLTLVGDASDGVKGAKGIGPKKAATLLSKHGTLDAFYEKLDEHGLISLGLTPADAASLLEFRSRLPVVRALITMRTDVDIPFDEILKERVPKDAEMTMEEEMTTDEQMPDTETLDMFREASAPGPAAPAQEAPATATTTETVEEATPDGKVRQVQVQTQEKPAPTPPAPAGLLDNVIAATGDWEKQLEPRSMREAQALAENMFKSRLFSAYGTPAAVLAVILAGRELGMQAVASLRAFHVIDGKPTLPADLFQALVLKSKLAKYFRCTARTATSATFETQRGDNPPISLTYTIEEGRQAFSGRTATGEVDEKAWSKSGWGKNPADMCVARARAKLARLEYPDVTHNLYAREEFDNG